GAVSRVTADHSLVEQLVREGRLSPEEAQHHPQRAIITRALGVDAHVEVDTYRVELEPGDRLLLCSDGLTNMLSDDAIAATLRRHPDPQQAADTLVDMANQAGGDDNITVVVLGALADGTDGTGGAVPAAEARGAAGADAEPAVEAPAPDAPAGDRPAPVLARPTARRLRGVLVWALPILLVVGIGVGAVGWYARRTYYVGLSADRVTVFKGVPGRRQPVRDPPGTGPRGHGRNNDHDHDDGHHRRHGTDPVNARRSTELGLVILAVILAAGGYVLTALARGARLPADLAPFAAGAAGLALVAHL